MAALFGLLGEADKVKKGKQNNVLQYWDDASNLRD